MNKFLVVEIKFQNSNVNKTEFLKGTFAKYQNSDLFKLCDAQESRKKSSERFVMILQCNLIAREFYKKNFF